MSGPPSPRVRLDPSSLKPARHAPPLSKSDAQRRLVVQHLLGQPLTPPDERAARDVHVLARALRTLRGAGPGPHEVDCEDGGAPFRFFAGQAAVAPGVRVNVRGTQRLGERPHQPLLDALEQGLGEAGLRLERGAPWPLRILGASGRVLTPRFEVPGAQSSQFASSLLFAAGALSLREGRSWTVGLLGGRVSEGYLSLTLEWMRRAGFVLDERADGIAVESSRVDPGCALPEVPGDWSSLGYLLLLAWRTGGTVTDVDLQAPHPDAALARLLRQVGLTLETQGGEASVRGAPARGLEASAEECPDLLPTLSVLACSLPSASRLGALHLLRAKESDRAAGIRQLVGAGGGLIEEDGADALRILPPPAPPSGPFRIESHGDHRLAMCGALLSLLQGRPAVITEPDCVRKSFPGFWGELERAGVALTFS